MILTLIRSFYYVYNLLIVINYKVYDLWPVNLFGFQIFSLRGQPGRSGLNFKELLSDVIFTQLIVNKPVLLCSTHLDYRSNHDSYKRTGLNIQIKNLIRLY